MNEKTLEEQLEEELKDQLTDISMLHTGNPEKTEAIKAFAVLYDKRQDTIKLKAEAEEAKVKKKDRVVDHIISCLAFSLMITSMLNTKTFTTKMAMQCTAIPAAKRFAGKTVSISAWAAANE